MFRSDAARRASNWLCMLKTTAGRANRRAGQLAGCELLSGRPYRNCAAQFYSAEICFPVPMAGSDCIIDPEHHSPTCGQAPLPAEISLPVSAPDSISRYHPKKPSLNAPGIEEIGAHVGKNRQRLCDTRHVVNICSRTNKPVVSDRAHAGHRCVAGRAASKWPLASQS